MREIKLTVNADGTTQTDFSGFIGKACVEEAEKLKALLASFGIRVEETNFTPKPELDQTVTTTQEQQRITQEGS